MRKLVLQPAMLFDRSIFLIAIFIGLFANPLRADEGINKANSLALQWSRADDSLESNTQTVELDSDTLMLIYGRQLTNSWRVSLDAWSGGDDFDLSNNRSLEHTISGFGGDLSYQIAAQYVASIGVSFEDRDTKLSKTNNGQFYQESSEIKSVFSSLSYDFTFHEFDISPSLGLTYQDSKIERELDAQLNFENLETFRGMYASLTVNTIYLIEGSNQLLWLPSVSLGWSETLWGDITNISRNGTVHSEDQSEGSGFVSFAITAILNDYFADISLSQSTGSGEGRNSIAFQLGLDF